MGMRSDAKTLWASAMAASLLFAVLIAGMWQFSLVQRSLDRQALLSGAAFAQRDRLLQIVNEETGMRGYVATGSDRYLEIYYASRGQWPRDTAVILNTQSAMPALEPRVRRSIAAAQAVQSYFENEIALMRAGRVSQAKSELSKGKALVDRLRALDATVQREADAQLNAQRMHTRFLAIAGITASIALCIVLLVWVAGFIFVLRRARNYRLSSQIDPLTGAQNRRGAFAAIDAQLGAMQQREFGLVFLDLDGFKKINDIHGHATGDDILRQVTSRLQAELRPADSVCRIGGDEFICVIAPPASAEQVRAVAERLRRSVGRPYEFGSDSYVVGCSVGVSMFPQHGKTAELLLARADSAMYAAKASGGGVREATAVAPWQSASR